MNGTLGLLETTGLTPAMVALDVMLKSASVRLEQLELNDSSGVLVKISGDTGDVQAAMSAGKEVAARMQGNPTIRVLTRVAPQAVPVIRAAAEFSALIQQSVVFQVSETSERNPERGTRMEQENTMALGFIETQGFTAAFAAVDTACKAAGVEVVAKEKLGGGYITVVVQGPLSAVTAAVDSGKESVGNLGKLIAAHVIARPSETVLKLLPRL